MVTRAPGPGLDPDSASYMGAAESFAHGHGLRIPFADWDAPQAAAPLAHFPPGFPIVLSIGVAGGVSAPQTARVVNALAFAATVGILAYLVASSAGVFGGIAIGIALLLARPIVFVHLSVLSEPLFLALLAATLLALVKRAHPLVSGSYAALAALVRYAGISASGAVVLWELIQPREWKERIRRAVLAGIPTLVLFGAWLLRTHQHRAAKIRDVGIYGGFGQTLAQGGRTVAAWLIPTSDTPGTWRLVAGAVAAAAIIGLIVAGVRMSRRRVEPRAASAPRILAAAGTLVVCYLGVVVVSRLFADPGIPLDERILAPFILLVTTMTAVAIGASWRSFGLLLRAGILVSFAAWLVGSALADYDDVSWATTNGSDFAGEDWRESPTIAWVRAHAANEPLYSNWPAAIYFHVHRPAWLLPDVKDAKTLRAFGDTLASRHGVVIAFDAPSPDVAPVDTIVRGAGLREIAKLSDGVVYGSAATGAPATSR
ncbi:MAG TPA: hypothetical protein VHB25_17700 [Gemmatimonadaceae bacterium]|nr:hypothetical protein [Gemmatimonadaceae bacterium]